ncbi:hypothetical protein [Flavobacterium sp. MK4S-17]|uniref:hypothetical protein n=1 Tax=Flavobacterium sp. MK4S-17 TaxID=2543737 RepID=UPI0013567EC8|nr:hypothetical protein [Flavobacterium sp. MK4S-17]
MTVRELLKERNTKILARYKELKEQKVSSGEAKNIIRKEFDNISISTIDQIIYNKKYSNSPLKK